MSRLQRRIDQTREEEVRPRVPRVEGPLSERPRPKVHIPWVLGEEAARRARGGADRNSCSITTQEEKKKIPFFK